jgi:integrase
MASIGNDKNGKRRILFVAPDGKRKTIRLGKCSQRDAESFKYRVENLLSARIQGREPGRDDANWLDRLPDKMHTKLSKSGLINPRDGSGIPTVANFVERYIQKRADVKPGTRTIYRHTQRNLLDFFGKTKRVDEVHEQDALDFKVWLVTDQSLAENTARKRCGLSKQFFQAAKRAKLIQDNPFEALPCSIRENTSKFHFITTQDAQAILEACPDAQWRVIFGLCRWGGLRCPSEITRLKWEDVHWEEKKITIHASKTEHHANGGVRVIPLFPELEPLLLDAFELAEGGGSSFVVTRYNDERQNLRTQFGKIIKRAGLTPWPKPFVNLRSTRETELTERFPVHTVCDWIGNTPKVAMKHYLQTTDEHFLRAVSNPTDCPSETMDKKAAQNPAQLVAQNAAQQVRVGNRNHPQGEFKKHVSPNVFAGKFRAKENPASGCQSRGMVAAGFEPA